ncbi:MAG: cell division protein FtsZ [Candidatus Micrarchaeota archaeon]
MTENKEMLKDILPEGQTLSKEDEELFKFLEESKPKIYVIGTGGSGCNTLARIGEMGIEGSVLISANTDVQHLVRIRADKKILLGRKTTKGLGAGSNPELGEAAAKESESDIQNALKNGSMVFITCGLGGGTGTGSAHFIADKARNMGALTIAVVTLPFTSEGKKRMENALDGLNKLKKHADTVIVIPNDKLLTMVPDLPLNTAFKVSDEVLSNSVKGIAELVTMAGLVNLDFADLKTVLKNAGCAVVGMGEATKDAKYDQRALIAIETAMSSPLLDVDISEADRALINVVGGEDMTLREAELMVKEVSKRIKPDSHIIWGARVDKELHKNSLRVLVVIAGAKLPHYEIEIESGSELDEEFDIDLIN